jgi:hypothetical protein
VTPHDEFQLIRDNDPAAAIALGLSLLGFVLPVVQRHRPFVIGFRFRRRDARRLRRVCARVHLAFFRRRLTAGDISRRTIP